MQAGKSRAALVCFLTVAPGLAFGAHRPKTVSLNGGDVWTAAVSNCSSNCASKEGDPVAVCPGEGISVAFKVQITSGTAWNYTGYIIEGYSEVCLDTPNHSSNSTFTETFNIVAPLVPGTYNLKLDADGNNSCSSPSGGDITLVDAITVLPESALECCDPVSGNDATCDGGCVHLHHGGPHGQHGFGHPGG